MKIFEKTWMMKSYLIKFAIRIVIFLAVLILYLTDKSLMYKLMNQPLYMGVTPIHILWLIFMGMMFFHIFPLKKVSMALLKSEEKEYVPQENYSKEELMEFVQDQNIKAWKVMLIWLCFNAIFGFLYVFNIIDETDLLMLTVFRKLKSKFTEKSRSDVFGIS